MSKLTHREIQHETNYLADLLDAVKPRFATGKRVLDGMDVKVGDTICEGKKEIKVTSKTECPLHWRTHIHVNKTLCYDGRVKMVVKS